MKENIMKKILVFCLLILGIIFITGSRIGANMNQNFTQVSAKHILVSSEKQALELKEKIENNEISFEEAAQKYSSCPSGKQGGDLGYFAKGMMVKPFEEAAFSADLNKVTKPIQTQFGWHLIKVVDRK